MCVKRAKKRLEKRFIIHLAGAEALKCFASLLRCPKFAFGLERRQILTAAPFSPRFIRHRRRFGDNARHAPRASGSSLTLIK